MGVEAHGAEGFLFDESFPAKCDIVFVTLHGVENIGDCGFVEFNQRQNVFDQVEFDLCRDIGGTGDQGACPVFHHGCLGAQYVGRGFVFVVERKFRCRLTVATAIRFCVGASHRMLTVFAKFVKYACEFRLCEASGAQPENDLIR